MGEMVEKSRVFVKNVTDVFGKADGGRFKCPRCKGSGLNSSHQFWNRRQSSDSSESCWFCEGSKQQSQNTNQQHMHLGVGVMPLVGLTGFILGRSKPMINTKQSNPLPKLPMNLQLYLGKFPETKCKVIPYKTSKKLADLLYDPNQIPCWMNGACGGVSTSESSSDRSSLLTKTAELVVERSGSKFQASRKPNPSVSKILPRRTRGIAPRRAGGSLFVTVRKSVSNSIRISSSPPKMHRSGVLADSLPDTRKSPLLRALKSSRFPRGERNRVREEAEKEAYLRSYKFQNSLLETRNPAVPDSSDSRQTGGGKIERFVNLSLGGIGLINGQQRKIVPSRKTPSDAAIINQVPLGKVKEGLMRTPSLGKAF